MGGDTRCTSGSESSRDPRDAPWWGYASSHHVTQGVSNPPPGDPGSIQDNPQLTHTHLLTLIHTHTRTHTRSLQDPTLLSRTGIK